MERVHFRSHPGGVQGPKKLRGLSVLLYGQLRTKAMYLM